MRYSSKKQLDNSHFPDALNTTYVSPRERKLLNNFRYIDDVEGVIVCEAGLVIDGASFGRLLSPIFGEQHDYDIPAAPHDRLYLNNNVNGRYLTRKQCDEVLYRAMKCAGFQEYKAKLFYYGVRLFGLRGWYKHRNMESYS